MSRSPILAVKTFCLFIHDLLGLGRATNRKKQRPEVALHRFSWHLRCSSSPWQHRPSGWDFFRLALDIEFVLNFIVTALRGLGFRLTRTSVLHVGMRSHEVRSVVLHGGCCCRFAQD